MLSKKPPPLRVDDMEGCCVETGGEDKLEKADGFDAGCCGAGEEKLKLLKASSRPPNDCFGPPCGDCSGGEDIPPNC